jgi:hypothetical protein
MPGTDTSNLAETLVRLARELLGSPTSSHTIETVTLGDCNAVNHLVLFKDAADLDGLLKEALCKLDLLGNASTVHLNLHQVSLLLLERSLVHLGVGQHTNNCAVLLHALNLAGNGLALALGELLGILGECLPLGLVPVLVESSSDFVAKMLGPDSGESTQTARSFDVSNESNNNNLCMSIWISAA